MWKPGEQNVSVGVYVNPPLAFPCSEHGLLPSEKCADPGLSCRFFALCLNFLNLSYRVTEVSDSLGSYAGNNTWSGLLGMVQNGSVDSIAYFAAYTSRRLKYFSYTVPFYDVRYAFVVKFGDLVTPSDETRILVDGFSKEVWITLLVTTVVLLVSWTCGKWAFSDGDGRNRFLHFLRLFLETCWEKGAYVLQQDRLDLRRTSASKGILFVLLSAMTVIMINVYQNIIFNQIASTAKDTPFRTTSELVRLVERGKLTMLSDSPQSSYLDYVNNSSAEHFQQVRRALSKNPLRIARDLGQATALLERGGYVYVTSYYFAMNLVKEKCDLTILFLDTSTTFWGGFIFSNQSKLRERFDKATGRLRNMLEHIELETAEKYRQFCPGYNLRPVTVKNFSGIFILYVAFSLACVLTLAVEKAIGFFWRGKTTQVYAVASNPL